MLDSHSFRQIMGCFATGVTVVTTRNADGEPVGLTVNSLTSVSLNPPLVLFCLDKKAHVYPMFRQSDTFAINILSSEQQDISRLFAGQRPHTKPKRIWDKSINGCPLLTSTLGWMICRKAKTTKGGDHDIFLGEVIKIKKRSGDHDPLLYFHGRYREMND